MQIQAILLSLIILISVFTMRTLGDNNPGSAVIAQNKEDPPVEQQANIAESVSQELPTGATSAAVSLGAGTTTPVSVSGDNPFENDTSSSSIDDKPRNCDLSSGSSLNLTAKAALLKYLNYGSDIFQKSPEKRWPIASVTKLMTAVMTVEKIDLNKRIIVSANAASSEGAVGDFKEGEIFKVEDLLKAMLVVSSNDAAVALAESYGLHDFVNEMQKKAADLRMSDTSYTEPTGLSFLNQSTIGDLSRLAEYIYANHPEIYRITRQKEIQIQELKSGKYRKLTNIDEFSSDQDFIGGKTGFIDAAGRNLVALFNLKNQLVLSVVLGSDDAFADTRTMKDFLTACE